MATTKIFNNKFKVGAFKIVKILIIATLLAKINAAIPVIR
jgi:hypothetical protein